MLMTMVETSKHVPKTEKHCFLFLKIIVSFVLTRPCGLVAIYILETNSCLQLTRITVLQVGSLAFNGWFTLLAGIDFLHINRA